MLEDITLKITNILKKLPVILEQYLGRIFVAGAVLALLFGVFAFFQYSYSLVHKDTEELPVSVEQINEARFNEAVRYIEEHNNPDDSSFSRNPFTR